MLSPVFKLHIMSILLILNAASCRSAITVKNSGRKPFPAALDSNHKVSKPIVTVVALTNSFRPEWSWTPGEIPGSGAYRYAFSEADLKNAVPTELMSFTPAEGIADGSHTLFVEALAAPGDAYHEERDDSKSEVWSAANFATVVVDTSAPVSPLALTIADSVGGINRATTYATKIYFEWDEGNDRESGVRDYTVTYYDASACSGTSIQATGNISRSHSITPNIPGTYSFNITTFNTLGLSSASSCSGDISVTVPPPLHAPTSLNALFLNVTDAAAVLTWDLQSESVTYKLERAPYIGSCGPYSEVYSGSALTFGSVGLNSASTYCYRVRGNNAGGDGPYSSAIQVTTRASAPATISTANAAAATSLIFSSVSGADSYNVYWSTSPGVTIASNSIASITSPFSHIGLSGWYTYYYRVAALKDGIIGMLSEEVSGHALPTVSATIADASTGIFCPRVNLSATAAPVSATQYCVQENSTSTSGCVWKNLPLPAVIRSSLPNTSVAITVFMRDASSNEFMGGLGATSGNVGLGPTHLPADPTTWAAVITNAGITASQIDELNCRVDQLTAAQGLSFANIRLSVYANAKRLKTSQQLNRVVLNNFDLTTTMSAAASQKALWRLMMTTVHTGGSLTSLDISKVDLNGRNVTGMDFTGTNISGAQLNGIDPKSYPLNLAGLNLSGWNPASTQSFYTMNISNATNVPWAAINANTNSIGYTSANFTGLDLSGWMPPVASTISSINFTNTTNIPWALLNTNSNGYYGTNFSGVDLTSWNPPQTSNISFIKYSGASNFPWAALNSNTNVSGFSYSDFSGCNLTGWVPPATARIDSIKLSSASNIPWAAINANTNAYGFQFSDFSGVNLTGWNPPVARAINNIIYTGSINIPWAAINANTNANGFSGSNFSGINLISWNPPIARAIQGITYTGATNIPWTAINANTNANGFSGSNFSGVDLTSWNPPPARRIGFITYTGASNIPWSAINSNTNTDGYRSTNFSGVNLFNWNPPPAARIDTITYSGAINVPWAAINANTHANGNMNTDFSGVDLSGWNPPTASRITGVNYTGATNIPWLTINANTYSQGYSSSIFSGVDLSSWSPTTTISISSITYTGAANIPWAALNTTNHGSSYSGSIFKNIDLTGFDPSGKSLSGATMPTGANNVSDFVEALGITPATGTTWIDGTKPWGP